MIYLRQSTASQEIPLGYFLDNTTGDDEEIGLTIANTDIKLWKSGATTLANKNSGGATHISNGIYFAVLDATDTNTLGSLIIFIHVSGALALKLELLVLPPNVYDSWILGTDKLEVDTVQISGDSGAADNCELDYDGTGYNKSNSEIGTCAVNTDMVGTDSAALASVCTEGRLAELDAGNLPTDIAAIKSDTGPILTDTGTTIPAQITALKDFDPAVDVVANVTLVGTVTTNTDMVGTNNAALASVCTEGRLSELDGANIPADIAAVKSDTGAILTDTGTTIPAQITALKDFDPAVDVVANVTLVDTVTTNTDMRGTNSASLASVCTEARLAELSAGNLPTDIAAIKSDTGPILIDTGITIPAQITALNDITVAEIIAGVTDGSLDLQEMLRVMLALLVGKSSGGGTNAYAFRDSADTKNRVTMTVDNDGNRTAVTLDGA